MRRFFKPRIDGTVESGTLKIGATVGFKDFRAAEQDQANALPGPDQFLIENSRTIASQSHAKPALLWAFPDTYRPYHRGPAGHGFNDFGVDDGTAAGNDAGDICVKMRTRQPADTITRKSG